MKGAQLRNFSLIAIRFFAMVLGLEVHAYCYVLVALCFINCRHIRIPGMKGAQLPNFSLITINIFCCDWQTMGYT